MDQLDPAQGRHTAGAVTALKAQQDEALDLAVMGSGELIQTLMKHNLVDRYVLLIHPLVLGSDRRLFAHEGTSAALQLVSAKATPTPAWWLRPTSPGEQEEYD